jgi:hypothetical protein
VDQLPPVKVTWMDPGTATPAATTDSVVKQVQAGILQATSDVALEALGYDQQRRQRIQDENRGVRASSVVADLATRAQAARSDARVTEVEARRGVDVAATS